MLPTRNSVDRQILRQNHRQLSFLSLPIRSPSTVIRRSELTYPKQAPIRLDHITLTIPYYCRPIRLSLHISRRRSIEWIRILLGRRIGRGDRKRWLGWDVPLGVAGGALDVVVFSGLAFPLCEPMGWVWMSVMADGGGSAEGEEMITSLRAERGGRCWDLLDLRGLEDRSL